jgi:hypothetical protein
MHGPDVVIADRAKRRHRGPKRHQPAQTGAIRRHGLQDHTDRNGACPPESEAEAEAEATHRGDCKKLPTTMDISDIYDSKDFQTIGNLQMDDRGRRWGRLTACLDGIGNPHPATPRAAQGKGML